MAAPASAAAIASRAISSGDTGRYGDIDGVWMAPVMAQVMIILPSTAIQELPAAPDHLGIRPIASVIHAQY
jgi:hypothetical protein